MNPIKDASSSQSQKLPTIPEEPKKEGPKIMVPAPKYRRLAHFINLEENKCELITKEMINKMPENKKNEGKE